MKISNERGAANDKFNTSKAKIQYKRSNQPFFFWGYYSPTLNQQNPW